MRLKTCLVLGFVVLSYQTLSHAAEPGYRKSDVSSSEVLALPQFCWWEFNAAFKDTKSQIQNCGPGTNHYCMALVRFNRSQRLSDRSKKVAELTHALRGVEYTLRWISDTKKMDSCSITEHVLQSYKNVRMAYPAAGLAVPPDKYPVSRTARSSQHPSVGGVPNHDDTNQPQLSDDADGDDSTKELSQKGAELPGASSVLSDSKNTNPVSISGDGSPEKKAITTSPEPEAAKIGSPSNPYCRFCPD